MAGIQDIIEEMRSVAPAGQQDLDNATRERLHQLTGLLIEADCSAAKEYEQFLGVKDRELNLTEIMPDLRAVYGGRRILVTGGTGCIGQALIAQLQICGAQVIYSLSRGRRVADFISGVTYLNGDITNAIEVHRCFAQAEPDVVFHLAAQRSPWLAERAVEETVLTNVVGTRNVLQACREFSVLRVVHASTGKAMKYYTTDVYAATKKVAEWLVHEYAAEGHLAGSGRFTHVVDNGVILDKIKESLETRSVCRIHEPDISFYVQSAVESAQLLLLAGLNTNHSRLRMVAIRSLGEPARLLSMALGMIGRSAEHPPIYFSGFETGYERGNPPGLYDPQNASDLSPLINAVESQSARALPEVAGVDEFYLSLPATDHVDPHIEGIEDHCLRRDVIRTKSQLQSACAVLAQATFDTVDDSLYTRLEAMAHRGGGRLPCVRQPKSSAVDGSDCNRADGTMHTRPALFDPSSRRIA